MVKENLRLILVRHGKTKENLSRTVQGHSEGELASIGFHQIKELASQLQHESINIVYSSDLQRAISSTDILVEGRSIPVISDARLREQQYGIYEGKSLLLMLKQMKKDGTGLTCFNPHKGEHSDLFRQRIRLFLNDIMLKHSGERVMIVTHFGVIKMLIESILHLKIDECTNSSFYSENKAIFLTISSSGKAKMNRGLLQ